MHRLILWIYNRGDAILRGISNALLVAGIVFLAFGILLIPEMREAAVFVFAYIFVCGSVMMIAVVLWNALVDWAKGKKEQLERTERERLFKRRKEQE